MSYGDNWLTILLNDEKKLNLYVQVRHKFYGYDLKSRPRFSFFDRQQVGKLLMFCGGLGYDRQHFWHFVAI